MPLSPLSQDRSRLLSRPQRWLLAALATPTGLLALGRAEAAIPTLEINITRQQAESQVEEHPMLEFTLEESETAMALFGCDCPHHLNQVRTMRGLPLLQEDFLIEDNEPLPILF